MYMYFVVQLWHTSQCISGAIQNKRSQKFYRCYSLISQFPVTKIQILDKIWKYTHDRKKSNVDLIDFSIYMTHVLYKV